MIKVNPDYKSDYLAREEVVRGQNFESLGTSYSWSPNRWDRINSNMSNALRWKAFNYGCYGGIRFIRKS